MFGCGSEQSSKPQSSELKAQQASKQGSNQVKGMTSLHMLSESFSFTIFRRRNREPEPNSRPHTLFGPPSLEPHPVAALSLVALSNLLSGPTGGATRPLPAPVAQSSSVNATISANATANALSPKRRYSDATTESSDPYYNSDGRARKSPRPNIPHATTIRPPDVGQSSSAAPLNGAEVQRPAQQNLQQPGQSSQRHAQARMRSSIACVRCRRSKVKCVNSGVGTPCRSCEAGGRECTYPVPVSSGRRRESVVGQAARPENLIDDQVRKPRQQRKSNAGLSGQPVIVAPEAANINVDVLDPSLLTPSVWQELFDIFQMHFSTDMPFIHPPTFLKPLRQASTLGPQYNPSTGDQGSTAQPPASIEFLLAFLALTARFHPRLVAHHAPSTGNHPGDPLVASEFYASAASARLKLVMDEKLGLLDLETTQALLMIALHDWGMNRGAQAWAYLGIATRSAQAMGLHYEAYLDDSPSSRNLPVSVEGKPPISGSGKDSFHATSSNDAFVQFEVRRRTYWTCFILDRYLSNGKYRLQTLNARDTHIQLPASEQAFLFGEQVRTLKLGEEPADIPSPRAEVQPQRRASMIGEVMNVSLARPSFGSNGASNKSDDEQGKWEVGSEEGLLSRYIKILDIYSKIVAWACGGGRRRDTLPPWNRESQWFALRQALEDFRTHLPRQHVLTPQNTSAHINIRTSTPYTLVHVTVSLCQILLYREFLPFIPFRHGRPQGPLDGTTRVSITDPIAPQGFWEDGGRECFGAARNIVDLVRTCQEWGVAVETPIVGFAVYNVALLGVYLINFPWMDVKGHLRRSNPAREDHVAHGAEAARKALEMIGPMRTRIRMGEGWVKILKRSHQYFSQLRTAWFDSAPRMMQGREREIWNDQSIATAQLHPPDAESTRVLFERVLGEVVGGDEDSEVKMTDAQQGNGMAGTSGSDVASPQVKQESGGHSASDQHAQQEERWNAINSVAAAASALSAATSSQTNSGHFRFYSSYGSQSSPSTAASYPSHSFRPSVPDAGSPSSRHQRQKSPHGHAPGGTSWTPSNGSGNSREGGQGVYGLVSPPRTGGSHQSEHGGHMARQQRRMSEKEISEPDNWLMGLEKAFGADDLAAFVDGIEIGDVARGLTRAGKGGWLGAVWGLS